MLDDELVVCASVPSQGSDQNLLGVGTAVTQAIGAIETLIAPAIIGYEPDLIAMDMHMLELDAAGDGSNLGSQAMFAVSSAVVRAQALVEGIDTYELIAYFCGTESVSLPYGLFSLLNGGVKETEGLAFKDCMVLPAGAQNFRESMEQAVTLYHIVGNLLVQRKKTTGVGLDGGYAASFADEREALDLLMEAVELAGMSDAVFALDIQASTFYDAKRNKYRCGKNYLTAQALLARYVDLVESYPIYSLQDGFAPTDKDAWQELTNTLGQDLQIAGGELFASNPGRIIDGITSNSANAAVIKPSELGTVTQALQAIKLCKDHDINTILSHCSGETNDPFIVDLAVGSCAGQVAAGGLSRGERIAKYNEMLKIEDMLMHSMLGS
jgi:enolase